MALSAGTRLGPFEIGARIGAGGMGEVYRARDTHLGRDVAIKVLPDAFAQDAERLARFEREARTLASLNHLNIATVYGLEEADGVRALVMELVEGPTLADRIAHGPLTPEAKSLRSRPRDSEAAAARGGGAPRGLEIDDALPIAKQIAEALEAAHELGIIHRDLKPANIKVRPDGIVKVLDFGLAKALEPVAPGSTLTSLTNSPTMTSPTQLTGHGLVLGTAAYMSPEQATGRHVDKRSDLWAFGVVLLEMLTGRPTFAGDTVPEVLASVLKSDPDWSALPDDTPAPIRRLLRRCLEKNRTRRLDSASVARLEIEDALALHKHQNTTDASVAITSPPRGNPVAPALGGLLLGGTIAALAVWALLRPDAEDARLPTRFAIAPPAAHAPWVSPFDRSIALSPDGRYVVYTTPPTDGPGGSLLIRPLDRLEATAMSGISRARAPFFSADSRSVGFFQDNELKKASISGGPALSICAVNGAPRGASWGDDGTIVFATSDPTTGLWRVPSGGGESTSMSTPAAGEGDHVFPSVLPAGRGVLFTIAVQGQADRSDIAVLDLETNEHVTLIRGGSQPEYVETGHIVYAAAGTLRAVRFDLATLKVLSDPAPVLEKLRMAPTGAANYAVSRAGGLLYLPADSSTPPERALVWLDRAGREEPVQSAPRTYALPRISPDGRRVALDIRDEDNDIWILDLARGSSLRKLTNGPSAETNPIWTADGTHIVFTSNRSGPPRLFRQAADGTGSAESLTAGAEAHYATSAMPDGTGAIGHRDGPTTFDVVLFRFRQRLDASVQASDSMGTGQVEDLVKTPAFEHGAELSPNGRYLAYQSNESGGYEVVVRPFPQVGGGRWTVSAGGGTRPLWARNGKELFYRDGAGAMVAVPVDTSGGTLAWSAPVKLFDRVDVSSGPERNYDVSPDGRRFLMIKETSVARPTELIVVLDWFDELKRLLANPGT